MIELGACPRLVLVGDAVERLRELPDSSVDCVVTSPPYWSLRDYGVKGQLGLESSWRAHLDALVRVFVEVKRVLKPSGVLWVNYGDTTAGKNASGPNPSNPAFDEAHGRRPKMVDEDAPHAKHKLGLAWRLRFRLNDELGLISRSDIVWWKRNTMPLSMKDRPTPKYEMLFMFVKEPRYWFDLDAIRVPYAEDWEQREKGAPFRQQLLDGSVVDVGVAPSHGSWEEREVQGGGVKGTPPGVKPRSPERAGRFNIRVRDAKLGRSAEKWGGLARASEDEVSAYDEREYGRVKTRGNGGTPKDPRVQRPPEEVWVESASPLGSNPGDVWPVDVVPEDVWDLPSSPFGEAHFATFPLGLPLRAVRASCPERVCVKCGVGWVPRYETRLENVRGKERGAVGAHERAAVEQGSHDARGEMMIGTGQSVRRLVGFKECGCGVETRPGVVLDPFSGAFTTCLAAAQLGRGWVGIELNPRYVEIGARRLAQFVKPLGAFEGSA